MITSRDIEIPIQCSREPSADLWSLLCSMLSKDPSKRVHLKDVAKHRFWNVNAKQETNDVPSIPDDNPKPIGKPVPVELKVSLFPFLPLPINGLTLSLSIVSRLLL